MTYSQKQVALAVAGGVLTNQIAMRQGLGGAAMAVSVGAVLGCAAVKMGYVSYDIGKDSQSNALEAAAGAAGGAAAGAYYAGGALSLPAALSGAAGFGIASLGVDYAGL